jgi:hypothetical protein
MALSSFGFEKFKFPLRKGTVQKIKQREWFLSEPFSLKVDKVLCGNSKYRREHCLYDIVAYDVDFGSGDNVVLGDRKEENKIRLYLGEDLSLKITNDKKYIVHGEIIQVIEYGISYVGDKAVTFIYKLKK